MGNQGTSPVSKPVFRFVRRGRLLIKPPVQLVLTERGASISRSRWVSTITSFLPLIHPCNHDIPSIYINLTTDWNSWASSYHSEHATRYRLCTFPSYNPGWYHWHITIKAFPNYVVEDNKYINIPRYRLLFRRTLRKLKLLRIPPFKTVPPLYDPTALTRVHIQLSCHYYNIMPYLSLLAIHTFTL